MSRRRELSMIMPLIRPSLYGYTKTETFGTRTPIAIQKEEARGLGFFSEPVTIPKYYWN